MTLQEASNEGPPLSYMQPAHVPAVSQGANHTGEPPRSRRGGTGTQKTCTNCHRLIGYPYHHEGEKKLPTGQLCPRLPCAGTTGEGMCSRPGCPCYDADPKAVVDFWKSQAEAARLEAEQGLNAAAAPWN